MEIVASFLFGIVIGSAVTYYVSQKWQQKTTVKNYESQIQSLKNQHQQALKEARNRSLDGSRAVIKGRIAEQLAPVLPNFKYLPSDARFVGDPIDYIVFNGYTNIKDNAGDENELEIILLDIKTGQATLSRGQQAIARAVDRGKVRFEVVRPESFNRRHPVRRNGSSKQETSRESCIQEVRKTYSRAYELWTQDEDDRLEKRYQQGATIPVLVKEFQRQPGGIRSRLKKLGLLE